MLTFDHVVTISTGVRSQNDRLIFSNAIYHTNTQTYEYAVNITQNTVINQTILTAQCIDTEDPAAIITYSLPLITLADSLFTVTLASGEVKLAVDSLILENDTRYDTQIRCSSSSYESDITASLRVHYQLKNEFSPVFSNTEQLQLSFSENNDISGDNGIIHDFDATDSDRGDCGVIEYSITSANTDLFQINSTTGVLSFIRSLDRELKDQHTITIQTANPLCPASDKKAYSSVNIAVEDTNDTPPKFSQVTYTTNITENEEGRRLILKVSCSDPDSNSRISYSMESRQQFFMDTEGNIFVDESVDYEDTQSFSFLVYCRDDQGGSNQVGNATVNVAVIPINEHRPHFKERSLTVILNDTAPVGTVVVAPAEFGSNASKTYIVTDRDQGLNHGEYNFTLANTNESENFDLDPKTGILRLKRKFRKLFCGQENGGILSETIHIRIIACDVQDLAACESLQVTLYVLTSNCNVFFPINSTNISISELAPAGQGFLSLPCEDYSNFTSKTVTILSNDKDVAMLFSYNPKNGSLYLLKPLDYEVKDFFLFQLKCSNNYNTTATVEVVVNVLPENEHKPVFDKAVYVVKLDDSVSTVPRSVEQINASDQDRGHGGDLSYSLAEPSQYFSIGTDGQIWLIQTLPHSETVFPIAVSVSDGEFSANTTVIVLRMSAEAEDSAEYTILVLVFSATLVFLLILLLLSWIFICRLGCRRNRRKRVGCGPSESSNRQNL